MSTVSYRGRLRNATDSKRDWSRSRGRSITRGEVPKPGADIRERYNCRWVLTDTQHGAFLSQARQDPRMRQVYADRDAVVFFVSAS